MPTERRRPAITETPSVQAKLAPLRAKREGGAGLRQRLADRVRSRNLPVSREAAEEVRASGWARQ